MKNLRFFYFLFLLLSMPVFVSAQLTDGKSNIPVKGWFLGLNGGVNTFMGEGNNFFNTQHYVSIPKSSGLTTRLTVGYHFDPLWSLRAMFGYQEFNYTDIRLKQNTDGSFPVSKYPNEVLTLDVAFDLSNWIGGVNLNRKFGFSAFAGGGSNYLNKNETDSKIGYLGRLGLLAEWHVSNQFNFELMAEGNAASDNQNDFSRAPLKFDVYSTVSLGFVYKFRGRNVEKNVSRDAENIKNEEARVSAAQITEQKQYNKASNVVDDKAEKNKNALIQRKDTIQNAMDGSNQPNIISQESEDVLNEHFFFNYNVADHFSVDQNNKMKVIADFAKSHPDQQIVVSGFADRKTGTIEGNNEISRLRAVTVANKMIREYAVAYRNIVVKWYGGGIQPYISSEKNRLVIVRLPKKQHVAIKTGSDPNVNCRIHVIKNNDSDKEVQVPDAKYINEGPLYLVVHFADKVAEIDNEAQLAVVKKAGEYLQRHPEISITISGYADKLSDGDAKNMDLSKKRAISVASEIMLKYPVSAERVHVKWYGAQKQNGTLPTMNRLVLIESIR